jgi:hypothetical protein
MHRALLAIALASSGCLGPVVPTAPLDSVSGSPSPSPSVDGPPGPSPLAIARPDLGGAFAPTDAGISPAPDLNAPKTACIPRASSQASGHHNAGSACLGCHGGGGAPTFSFAGTLYDSAGNAVTGATIEAVDANGQTVRVVSAQNGNFYTASPLTFPLTVRASGCPDDHPMSGLVSSGDCASGGCHAAIPITLP